MAGHADASEFFTFTMGRRPACHLTFGEPAAEVPWQSRLKRSRSLEDVDGDGQGIARNKKRRLRLLLVTSRLSRPFSAPPSHIVNRGSCKIAVWAKQKALGRNQLRKAAILNHVRMRAIEAHRAKQRQMEVARQSYIKNQSSIARTPRRHHLPLPTSPLGLSNYDALDLEDDFRDDGSDSSDEGGEIYSDFNILDPAEPVVNDYDSLNEHTPWPSIHRPPSPLDEVVLELSKEKERQKTVSFVQLYDM